MLDLDSISSYYRLREWQIRLALSQSFQAEADLSLNFFITHIKVFDIYCGNEAEKFDRDCSYSLSVYSNNTVLSYVHPLVILSCNPSRGNESFIYLLIYKPLTFIMTFCIHVVLAF